MSQREDLLRGARECIAEKGYSRITARDIAAASGANLASIGYHFGSKDALLNAAVLEAFDEWGEAIEDAVKRVNATDPFDRLAAFLEEYTSSIPDRKVMMIASLQAFAEAEFIPEIRKQLKESHAEGRRNLAALITNCPEENLTREDLAVGSLALSLLNGIALQWFTSPEESPSAPDIASAIRKLTS